MLNQVAGNSLPPLDRNLFLKHLDSHRTSEAKADTTPSISHHITPDGGLDGTDNSTSQINILPRPTRVKERLGLLEGAR